MRLLKFTANYKASIGILILIGFIGVGFSVLQPLAIKYFIDNVLSKQPLPESLKNIFNHFGGVPDKKGLLIVFVIASVFMVISNSALSYISTNVTTKVCQKLVHYFSEMLFDKLQQLSLAFYSKNNVGDIMQRLTGDTYVIYSVVGGILLPTLMSITSLASMFYVMYAINSSLALMAICVVPVFAILLIVFNKPMTNASTYQYHVSGKLWSLIQQEFNLG